MRIWTIGVALCLLLSSGCGASWKEFKSNEGKFSVQMPGTPKESAVQEGGKQFMLDKGNRAFTVMFADMPFPAGVKVEPIVTDLALDGAAEGALKNSKATKLGIDKIKLGDHPGRDVKGTVEGGHELRTKLYMVKKRLYGLIVIGEKGYTSSADANRFFDSFKVTEEAAK